MKQMGFYFNQERCTGCYTCSIACKDWNDIPAGPVNWRKIKKIEEGKFPNLFLAYLSTACNHCANPPCVKACPTEAIIKRDSDGIVVVDHERCIGKKECGSKCLKVCPWNVPQFSKKENAKMQKCDFCLERLEQGQKPICVEACPMYALDAGPIDELKEKYGKIFDAEGFQYFEEFKPSILFNPKLKKSK
ncbi:MAG: 4Fe-4S dicluster domain-containing protein [Promethearchaeota archaeon]